MINLVNTSLYSYNKTYDYQSVCDPEKDSKAAAGPRSAYVVRMCFIICSPDLKKDHNCSAVFFNFLSFFSLPLQTCSVLAGGHQVLPGEGAVSVCLYVRVCVLEWEAFFYLFCFFFFFTGMRLFGRASLGKSAVTQQSLSVYRLIHVCFSLSLSMTRSILQQLLVGIVFPNLLEAGKCQILPPLETAVMITSD